MKLVKHGLVATLCVAVLLAAHGASRGTEIEKVKFADRVTEGQTELELTGVGLVRYKSIINAFVAALYVGEGVSIQQVLGDVPKRLEMEYFVSLKGADLIAAAERLLKDNVSEEELKPLRPRIDKLHALLVDIKGGDRYALTYLPGKGTELSINGKSRGSVDGADFAKAYFMIWLGSKPLDAGLRNKLLKR